MDLALWECTRLWPLVTQPDVVLSLGTGTEAEAKSPRSPRAPNFRHLFNDGFIPRLCRSFLSSLDGERAWRHSVNHLDNSARADYFRLNVSYSGEEPRLDDVNCMSSLRKSVHLQPQGSKDRASIAYALLAASFYFELDVLPKFEAGRYVCQGTIRCRNQFERVWKSLTRLKHAPLDFATETEHLGLLTPDDICVHCHLYGKKVQFNVRRLEELVSISLRVNELERRKISGCPHDVHWFIRQQRLDAPFGRADHDMPARWICQCIAPSEVRSVGSKKRDSSHLASHKANFRKRPKRNE